MEVLAALRDLGGILATTNYDGLLEQVTGRPAVTWQDQARAQAVLRGREQAIVHLHGFWREPGSVVLGVRSYEQLLGAEHAQVLQQAMTAMGTLLFVGFGAGLADPNFTALRAWMGRLFKGGEYRHFRLAADGEVAALQAEHGPDERVFVLGYGPGHADLAPYLRRLAPAPPQARPAGWPSGRSRASGLMVTGPGPGAAAGTAAAVPSRAGGVAAELDARLAGGDGRGPRTVVLSGLGGAGKTSVAVEYAHRHLGEVGVAWQLAAEDAAVLAAGFGELAAQLGARDGRGGIRWRRCTRCLPPIRGGGCWCSTMPRTGRRWRRLCRRAGRGGC